MIEGLLLAFLFYTGGYTTRYFTEPEKVCKTIKYQLPENIKKPVTLPMCKRGTDSNGIEHRCYVKEDPVYELLPSARSRLDGYIIELQMNTFKCYDMIEEYNNDKYIIKD